jgi:hypothetical protein
MFLDFDNNNGGTFYIDDIKQTAPPVAVNFDFETEIPEWTQFGGNGYEWVDNPDATGINTSSKVGKSTHGNESWAGMHTTLSGPIDFSIKKTFKLKVYGPVTGPVKLKIEDSTNGDINMEIDATSTKTNEWEELTWDFSAAASGTYDRIVLFFNFGSTDTNEVFYFDDLIQE